MTSVLERADVARGAIDEYEAFAALIEPLDAAAWDTPTRCTGFLVRDVAGHVVGSRRRRRYAAFPAAATPKRKPPRCAATRRPRSRLGSAPRSASIQPLLDALDDDMWNGPSGVPDLTFGRGVLTLWYDAFVHADDIRAALGRPSATRRRRRGQRRVPRRRADHPRLGPGHAHTRRHPSSRRERRRTRDHRRPDAVRARRDRPRRPRDDGPGSRTSVSTEPVAQPDQAQTDASLPVRTTRSRAVSTLLVVDEAGRRSQGLDRDLGLDAVTGRSGRRSRWRGGAPAPRRGGAASAASPATMSPAPRAA